LSVILFLRGWCHPAHFVDVGTGQRAAREAEREGLHA